MAKVSTRRKLKLRRSRAKKTTGKRSSSKKTCGCVKIFGGKRRSQTRSRRRKRTNKRKIKGGFLKELYNETKYTADDTMRLMQGKGSPISPLVHKQDSMLE